MRCNTRRFCRSVADDGHLVGYEHLGGLCFPAVSRYITGLVPQHDIMREHRKNGADDGGGGDLDAYLWLFPPLEVLTSRQERSSEIKSTACPASDFGWHQRRRQGRAKGYRKQNSGTSSHGTILSARYLIEWSEEIACELSLRLLCKEAFAAGQG